eukprot:gnl/TRDRNA2_/TRDRNA2_179558_c0_seq1.p1 gnl/TRDRNA2_/TRDRNA2_179558_c0~~gnl/TRDRNA2_/TRDRNA2_179558_c0_seq1.p1  ORF type:complete len:293 (-),score=61.92 gnl/TRDRNA2_/TRDRNA2_179558_c0_seq1:64-942(-)
MNPIWKPGVVAIPDNIRNPKGALMGDRIWSPATQAVTTPIVSAAPSGEVSTSDSLSLVTLIRGAKTRHAILEAGMLAKQLATTQVVWDSNVKTNPGALRVEEYGTEHQTEKNINAQALQTFPSPTQKCAFLHFASEKVWQHGHDVEDLIGKGEIETVFQSCNENIAETTQAFLSIQCYSEWIFTFKASVFFIIPVEQAKNTVIDTTNQVCRFVGTCQINFPDGTPGVCGLQLTTEDAKVNCTLLHRAMKDIICATKAEKIKMGGKTMALTPTPYLVLDAKKGAKRVVPALAA